MTIIYHWLLCVWNICFVNVRCKCIYVGNLGLVLSSTADERLNFTIHRYMTNNVMSVWVDFDAKKGICDPVIQYVKKKNQQTLYLQPLMTISFICRAISYDRPQPFLWQASYCFLWLLAKQLNSWLIVYYKSLSNDMYRIGFYFIAVATKSNTNAGGNRIMHQYRQTEKMNQKIIRKCLIF